MNSVSAAVTTDFYRRFGRNVTEVSALRVARGTVVIVGTWDGLSSIFAHLGVKSLWDELAKVLGLFGGGLAGVFFLGFSLGESRYSCCSWPSWECRGAMVAT